MSRVAEVKMRYREMKSSLDAVRLEQEVNVRVRKAHLEMVDRLELTKEEKTLAFENMEKALKVFQKVSDERNKTAKDAMETVINWALSKVLNSNVQSYEFKIDERADARSGRVMELYLNDLNTGHSRSLSDQSGTALAQIVSFLMILTVIKFSNSSKILILDEVFSGLEDTEMVMMFSDILTSLARNDGFQIFIVEQNSLISSNEDFHIVNVALDSVDDGLRIKSIT